MDRFKKRILKEFEDMERHMGRMMRNVSLPRMTPLQSGSWLLATDVYETEKELILCMDVMGMEPGDLSVVVEEEGVTVSGERVFPVNDSIGCIHQLEIERGHFERTIPLPQLIDPAGSTSICKNGYLLIRLPKQKKESCAIKIKVK
ncbi:MAG: Hsp20/alpha crystallin family protein [Proteobacteria bacterium]|nr:Hsp20/alpha crystallin family protein [Pseudomonadota bacterium]MBU1709279.1 Hsp20/alpha crystallin family protein [Pseudomonadota bacterium]